MHKIRLDIQGLRAIAVLAVIIFHAFPHSWLTGGFVGVDIFFVISGFLITKIIARDISAGKFSITDFYRRRSRRILPALTAVVLFTVIVSALFFSPTHYVDLWRSVFASMIFVSNFYFWVTTGYFDTASEIKPLLHTWSLSVEEQFYLFYPLFLMLLTKTAKQKTPLLIAILTGVLLATSQAMVVLKPEWAYFLTPARAFELLIGCSAALIPLRTTMPKIAAELVGALGLVLMLGSLFFVDNATPFPGIAAAVPCIGTALLLWVGGEHETVAGKLLSVRPLVLVGNLSYSLYLWHWPLLALPRYALGLELDPAVVAAALALTALASWASFNWIEQPFLTGSAKRLPALRLAVATIALFCVGFGIVQLTQGLPNRFSSESQAMFAAATSFSPERKRCHQDSSPLPFAENCIFGEPPPTVVLWGDSHGAEVSYQLAQQLVPRGEALMQVTASACPPSLGWTREDRPSCDEHNAETLAGIVRSASIKNVVLSAYLQNPAYGDQDVLLNGYEESVRALTAAGKEVLIIAPFPTFNFDVPSKLGTAVTMGTSPSSIGKPRTVFDGEMREIRARLGQLASEYQVTIVDPADLFCDSELCHAYDPDLGPLYFNADHLSMEAAKAVADRLAAALN